MPSKQEGPVETLEAGNLYFFYRPRVEEDEPKGVEDIQNLFVVLAPYDKKVYRLMIIGRERMPKPGERGGARFWGYVSMVARNPKELAEELGEKTYETKTRGTRHLPAARPAGEGVYQIVRHGDHTHLVYALELPKEPGEVQKELNIEPEASYIITIANPDKPAPPRVRRPERAQANYPPELRERFRDRRFADADPPDFLDYEGAEFVLIAASEDVKKELGIDLRPEDEDESSAEIFRDLKLKRTQAPLKPLFEGEWE